MTINCDSSERIHTDLLLIKAAKAKNIFKKKNRLAFSEAIFEIID